MHSIENEIKSALRRLSVPENYFAQLGERDSISLYGRIAEHFCIDANSKWLWESFKQSAVVLNTGNNCLAQLDSILRKINNNVWFMAEGDEPKYHLVFDAQPSFIVPLLYECFFFEYYIIDKDFNWLLCENHHNELLQILTIP